MTPMPTNDCRERRRLLAARIKQDDAHNRAAYDWHLQMCDICQRYLAEMAAYASEAVMPEMEDAR